MPHSDGFYCYIDSVQIKTAQGFQCDRKFGLARPNSGFDPDNPQPLPKTKFYMLARDAALCSPTTDMGVYAKVIKGGEVPLGNTCKFI